MKKKKQTSTLLEWKAYNKSMKKSNVPPMSLEDYTNWINGTTKRTKKVFIGTDQVLSIPSWANKTDHIPSVTTGTYTATKPSMVGRAMLGLESKEVADEIIKKSKRIGLMYSKGTYGYITDGTDVKELGKKNPTM